jgi:hypothetical protein
MPYLNVFFQPQTLAKNSQDKNVLFLNKKKLLRQVLMLVEAVIE